MTISNWVKVRKLKNEDLPYLIPLKIYANKHNYSVRTIGRYIASKKLVGFKVRGKWFVYENIT